MPYHSLALHEIPIPAMWMLNADFNSDIPDSTPGGFKASHRKPRTAFAFFRAAVFHNLSALYTMPSTPEGTQKVVYKTHRSWVKLPQIEKNAWRLLALLEKERHIQQNPFGCTCREVRSRRWQYSLKASQYCDLVPFEVYWARVPTVGNVAPSIYYPVIPRQEKENGPVYFDHNFGSLVAGYC